MAVIIKRLNYRVFPVPDSGETGTAVRHIESFNTTNWTLSGSDYVITIPATTHGKGVTPTVVIYYDNTITFEEVVVPVTIDSTGEVKIYVSSSPDNRFTGKAVII